MLTFAIKQKRTPSIAPQRHAPTVSPMSHSLHLQQEKVRHILRGSTLQPKLTIGQPNDKYEQEADRVADEVMRMPEAGVQRQIEPEEEEEETLQAKPLANQITPLVQVQRQEEEEKEEEETLQAKPLADQITPLVQRQVEQPEEEEEPIMMKGSSESTHQIRNDLHMRLNLNRGEGQTLPEAERSFMESRFGVDFSGVRVHIDSNAVQMNNELNAHAFSYGKDIYFGADRYNPGTLSGNKLIAHELTHVVQQSQQICPGKIQCQCSDPDFCTPYATTAEAISKETWLRTYFLPAMSVKFGSEVHDLWENFLSRARGTSLTRRVFDTPGNPIEDSFATSENVEDDQEAVLDLVVSRLSRFPGTRLRPHAYTMVSLTNFLTATEMDNRPINFSNPFAKCGNIAGGIGSSDAGPDYRKIKRANVVLEKVPLVGNSGYIHFQLIPFYEVYDAVDLCPGQCGSPAEQFFTIPLSRLEASGRAYDVPYVVKFEPDPETKREFYSNLPL